MSSQSKHVLIIGGGVVGLCSAYFLVKSGFEVTIVDRSSNGDSSGCSFGNAGFIVPSHFVPLAAPGMMSQGLKWMLRSDSPFYVKPRFDLNLLRWTMLFNQAATKTRVNAAAPILRDLSIRSKRLFQELDGELNFGLKPSGLRMMYQTEKCRAEELEMAEQAATLGIEANELSSADVQSEEPNLQTNVIGAVTYPGDASLNPSLFMTKMRESLVTSGVHFKNGVEVKALNLDGGKISSVVTDSGELTADEYVLAGGSWSQKLAKTIGLKLPVQAGKGYNFTVDNASQQVAVPSILCEAKVAVSPLGDKTRFGGTMELAGLDRSISPVRVNAIKKAVQQYFPDFDQTKFDGAAPWAGLRPCSPDGLPYIGRTAKAQNLIIATGHAMLGLSLGPVTGELIRDSILGKEQPSKLIDPDRYG